MPASKARVFAAAALLVSVGVTALVLHNGRSSGRTLRAFVPAADSIVRGTPINAGGRTIGSITDVAPVERGHAAMLTMHISDGDYWPLPRDSRLEIRFGGTVSFTNRYLLLSRGKDRAHLLRNGDALPREAVKTPVEVDELLNNLSAPTRRDLRLLLANAAPVLDRGSDDLRSVLAPGKAPLVTTGAGRLMSDLTTNVGELRTLVRSTSRVLAAADNTAPDVGALLTGFGQTASAIADESADLKSTLSQLPGALRQTRATLGKADVTLREAEVLVDDIGPGVTELRAAATPLTRLIARLRRVAPIGVSALRAARDISPLAPALKQATKLMPSITSIAKQSAKELDCLRPYAPELANFASTWGDFTGYADTRDRYARAQIENYLPAAFNSVPYTAGQAAKLFPGIDYGFPRPPGELAKQPWFQPQCGITEKSLDPAQDPESADFVKNRSGK